MTEAELNAVVEGVTIAVMAKLRAEFRDEIQELRYREPRVGPMGPQGPQGPMGERGERGLDGTDGENGRDGINGKDGATGPQGPEGHAGVAGLDGARGPIGPQGEKGLDGAQGDRGPEGPQGVAGRDGAGLVGSLINRDGHLVITMSDGTTKDVGCVIGPQGAQGEKGTDGLPGKDGINGKDGTLEAIAVKKLDYRTLQFCHKDNGEPIEGGTVLLDNVPMYPDPSEPVFKKERDYLVCDLVNWGGKVYYAKVAGCGIVPGDGSAMSEMMWGLFSDRGRMGKTGLTGPGGAVGPKGDKGDRGPERW